MSTKVKVGIAAVIVSALVALIVLDQKTTRPAEQKPTASNEVDLKIGDPASPATRMKEDVGTLIDSLIPTPAEVKKGATTDTPPKVTKPSGEEYVVVDGDTYEKISQKKWGNGKWAGLIAEANPHVKATALRPGQKIVLPPRPEKKEEKNVAKDTPAVETKKEEAAPKKEPVIVQNGPKGERIYVVQPGDTLGGISTKFYNTSRYVDKIVEANKIDDPSLLYVGLKLVMPDLPKKEATPSGGTANTSSPAPAAAAGKKAYTVQPGENLWKIASKVAGDRGTEETMKLIVSLNPDKLKGIGDIVRAGWQLVMPE